MASTPVSLEYVAIGCNRVSQAAAWADDGLVAFAANCFVALYRPLDANHKGILRTLPGHRDRINCLRFVRKGSRKAQRDVALVSGSADTTLRIWKRIDQEERWACSAVLEGHTTGVTCLSTSRGRDLPGEMDLIASSASDGTIRIWGRTEGLGLDDTVICMQVIDVGSRYPLCLALGFLPHSAVPLLVSGGTDSGLSVYTQQDGQFRKALMLQGHSDWIRSVEIATYTTGAQTPEVHFRDGDILIASASQDKYIRIWTISDAQEISVAAGSSDDFTTQMMDTLAEAGLNEGGLQLSTKAHIMEVDDPLVGASKRKYTVMFDALLMGHDDWVHSAMWQPAIIADGYYQPMALLSASSDKSIMMWRPDPGSDTWVNQVRLGEIGGSTLGFHGAHFSPDGNYLLGNGYNGAVHLWSKSAENAWTPQVGISGHHAPVEDLQWDPSGQFFISTSLDQTARLFAPWTRDSTITWHEIARPQIHGYDLHCLAFIRKYAFVSGADEKVLRVFEAPKTFVQSLQNLTKEVEDLAIVEQRPIGASVPALGLSNKAVFESDMEQAAAAHEFRNLSAYTAVASTPTSLLEALCQPPFEQHLLQHTLWPEINKLYGHGYEIISVAASHNGKFVASACKAAKPEHAAIRLWSTETWKEVCPPLIAHSLTVTGIRFSPDDKRILTVGRDRAWAIFELTKDGEAYQLMSFNAKAHMRIIWGGSWSHDGTFFATGSRDKTVKVWASDNERNAWSAVATLKLDDGVTAIEFGPSLINNRYIIGVGLENGRLNILQISMQADRMVCDDSLTFDVGDCHVASIKSLTWRNQQLSSGPHNGTPWYLATCSEDHSIRLYAVRLGGSTNK